MNLNDPLVTILLPVHNGEKYIKETLNTCLDQTYGNIEILIVDDASDDGTPEILKEYKSKSKKIKIYRVKKQQSLGAVLNRGLEVADGKYIARIDADDVMYPDRIEKQVELLERNKDVVVVGGQIDIIDENSKITGERRYALDDKGIRRTFFWSQPFAHSSTTFRKDIALEAGMYPEDLPKVEDVMFFFRLSTKGKFANLPNKVIRYRMTYNTESQAKMVDHFKRTSEVRERVIKELGIKPTFRQYILWNLEKITVFCIQWLPHRLFMWVFELARRIFK